MKFINLLKKELTELLNAQMIIGLVVSLCLLMLIGNVMKSTIKDAVSQSYSINLCDRDDTEFTQSLRRKLEQSGAKISMYETEGDDYSAIINDTKASGLIIIPEGFTEELLENGAAPEITSISKMESASSMSNISNDNSSAIIIIEKCLTEMLAKEAGMSREEFQLLNSPILVNEKTVVADKSAPISTESLMSKIMVQNMVLPIVVFVLIMLTSQTLISTISNEKIDKTLETLLSAPVSRSSVIGAKMLAASLIALINAAAYMFGFTFFVSGAADSATAELSTSAVTGYLSVETAMAQLGLSLGITDYILIGLQLFLTIMICLSVSLMLGAMVNDTKSSQSVIMPIMMLAMVPYLISMLADINSLPTIFRVIVYAIPFTHTFSAMTNLMFGNNVIFFGGLIYQIIVFAVCMFFALRLFKSDKIFTISLNFGQKSKLKKFASKNRD